MKLGNSNNENNINNKFLLIFKMLHYNIHKHTQFFYYTTVIAIQKLTEFNNVWACLEILFNQSMPVLFKEITLQ